MSALIPIREQADGTQAVSGRALHQFLELGRDYTTWFKSMTEYGFSEGTDYITTSGEVYPRSGENLGGRPRIDHVLTIDMAKELSMLQRSDAGKKARAYFIEVEKRYRAQAPRELSRRDLAQMVIEAEDRAELEAARADRAEHTVQAIESADGITLREFHKHYLSEVPERKFFEFLYQQGILINQLNTRRDERTGKPKNGKQHMHPAYKGKAWLYLHGRVVDGVRRESTRVRPGAPELAFAQFLASKGLPINSTASRHFKEIAA